MPTGGALPKIVRMPAAPRLFAARRRAPRVRVVSAWAGAALLLIAFVLLVAGAGRPQLALAVPVMALPLALFRRRPVAAALLMVLGSSLVSWAGREEWYAGNVAILTIVVADVAVGYVAAVRPRRASVTVAALALGTQVGFSFVHFTGAAAQVAGVQALAIVTTWVVGSSVRQRGQYAAARRNEAEARAVQAERLRIARELHDMIAHSIGVIAIQAGVGRRVIDTQPAEARNALTAIEDTSRDTLAALRRMLGTLRRTDPGSQPAPLDPAPGLADLDDLVARTRDAGVRVDLRRQGDPRPLPPDVDLSAYRIIQEAVTNVIRHAGTQRCDVLVDQRPDELTVEITDDGRSAGGAGQGYGIVGMRERVGLLGGEFAAGPQPGGGFRVAARIPVPATGEAA
jgi:signal transduction histidine kinase